MAVNDHRKGGMAGRVVKACGGDVRDKNIVVLGLAFKPGTDDMREAPSLPLIEGLVSRGAKVTTFDPAAMDVAKPMLPAGVTFAKDAPEAAIRRGRPGLDHRMERVPCPLPDPAENS